MEIGSGYQAVYGQLKDLAVEEGATVDKGTVIGYIAAPTWITCKESSSFQNWSVLSVCLKQCSCNAVSDSTSLSCVSAAFYINENIKFALCLCSSQWLTNDNFQCFKTEILVDISFIDCDFACTRCKVTLAIDFFLLPVP